MAQSVEGMCGLLLSPLMTCVADNAWSLRTLQTHHAWTFQSCKTRILRLERLVLNKQLDVKAGLDESASHE